jgi:hypothetical protein
MLKHKNKQKQNAKAQKQTKTNKKIGFFIIIVNHYHVIL